MSVVVLAPVLRRPERVEPLVRSYEESMGATADYGGIFFLCSPGDREERDAVIAAGRRPIIVRWEAGQGDYARKINFGYRRALALGIEWALLGADDLAFHPGWLEAALAVHEQTGACVVGTNDLGNPTVMAGHHSTHPLVHRDYLDCGTIDEDGKILHEGYWHNWCNPPEAPIWMGDLSFREIGEVRSGDTVVGWERSPSGRFALNRLCLATVLDVGRREAPMVLLTMESGREIRCTADHRWLNGAWSPSSSHDAEWVTPDIGRQLLHVIDWPAPVPAEYERVAGWLAGIYDGEGSGIYVALQSARHNPEVVAAISRALDLLGVRFSRKERSSGVVEFVLGGGRQGYVDFLERMMPVKRERLTAAVLGGRRRGARGATGAARFGFRDRIVEVGSSGGGEVISLKTSTGNYFAWGYASRNCDTEFVETARSRGTFAFARDSRVEHLHPLWRKGENDEVYELGQRRYADDAALFQQRRLLWG